MKKKPTWKGNSNQKVKKQKTHQYAFTNEKWYKRLNEFLGIT